MFIISILENLNFIKPGILLSSFPFSRSKTHCKMHQFSLFFAFVEQFGKKKNSQNLIFLIFK